MALTHEEQEIVRAELAAMCERAKAVLNGGSQYKATILLRAPHLADGDVIVTEDDDASIIEAVKRRSAFTLTPPTESPIAELPKMGSRCDECQHLFTPADLAAEDPNALGHPCPALTTHAHTAAGCVARCESHRSPEVVEPTTTDPAPSQSERLPL